MKAILAFTTLFVLALARQYFGLRQKKFYFNNLAKSECERIRENVLEIVPIVKLIPACKENGDYEALQCYVSSLLCVCYSKEGKRVSPILPNLKECDCYIERHEKLTHGLPDVPRCNLDGSYRNTVKRSST